MLEDKEWGKVGSDCSDYYPENSYEPDDKVKYLGFTGFLICMLSAFVAGFIVCGITRIF
jgi:hypothetical protein